MTTIFDILPQAEGAQHIRKCWGEVPQFKHIEILHLKHTISAGMADILILAFFSTWESDDLNNCKPSKLVIRFCDVSRFEFVDAFGDHPSHGVELDNVFTGEPSVGVLAIDTRDGFYIACSQVHVVSCIHEPFSKILDENDAV